jgi:hypothetical protein
LREEKVRVEYRAMFGEEPKPPRAAGPMPGSVPKRARVRATG